ncbi:MAG: flagellar biosynthesis protein FlhF [Gammaproteobacteria bacterium]|nr:flagellar biosynthesis protein FlhF [Gammaproteobacteria bacterium]
MKIKRFFAPEMREAIRQVKEQLGPDAVILSNNKVDGGIELVAAIDYDEEAVHRSINTDMADNRSTRKSAAAPQNRKKRSVFAKVRKQKSPDRLEDSIQDDVISFSNNHLAAPRQTASQEPSANKQPSANRQPSASRQPSGSESLMNEVEAEGFSELLQQSTQSQSIRARQESSAVKKHNAFSKPSVQERKQPYISDFSSYKDEFEQDDVLAEEAYPFDYESLVRSEQKRTQKNNDTEKHDNNRSMDGFFSADIQSDHTRTHGQSNTQGKARAKDSTLKSKLEWVQDPALVSMKEEIKSLRGILENQLSGLAWGDFARRHPHRAELLSRLYRLGLKSSLSEKIVKQLKNSDSLEDSWRRLLAIISRNIPTLDHDLVDEGGIIALVGPTGVGKTTNIAKIAARFTLKYGAKNLALVTTDSYRVGAHEQLKTYGRILGVTVYIANDEDELKQILSRLDDKQLVLIDTAGMSHRDLRLAQQLTMLRRSHEKMKILAVLSAASQTLVMDEVIKTFKDNELDGCIASKVDESTSVGGIISILIENRLQLNYISDGQKVPEDIHLANGTDLLKKALEMVRQHPVQVKTDELALSYSGGGLVHAFG